MVVNTVQEKGVAWRLPLFIFITGCCIMAWMLVPKTTNIHKFLPKLSLITIPAGEFDAYIPLVNTVEFTNVKKHVVIAKSFQMSAYEITAEQWDICFKDGGCPRKAKRRKGEGINHPVTRVNWRDAMQFTRWISAKTGQAWRLPTEEEWIYAAHAGKSYIDVPPPYTPNLTKARKITAPIGFYGKNEWGMADTKGGVWEWTLSCWRASRAKILAPISIAELSNPKTCYIRITHGIERAHIIDFIKDTYNGGCASGRPASNLGFRIMREN